MDLATYQTITGITVPVARQAFVTAQIGRVQRMLESMLGYTLEEAQVEVSNWTEVGKTSLECACPSTTAAYLDPDAVVGAYRTFTYNRNDKYLSIDPASAVHKVKLINGGITYRTIPVTEYRAHLDRGIIKYLEQNSCFCLCTNKCGCVQLAVDADWLWPDGLPDDLNDVFAQMVTYYSDAKNNIRSETLGSHSYTKFSQSQAENESGNIAIINKYAGPLGSVKRTITK